MKAIAEIFSQGEEVVCGQIVDSNAAWLSQQLNDMGFAVERHTAVGDDLDDLVGLIREIAERADVCICTGGLGPTVDDLTAEAAGIAAGQALRFDQTAMSQVEAYFAKRRRPMAEINRKQAYFPQAAERIDNPIGSAPGFALKIRRCRFVFLPGVPSEMKAMFPTVRLRLQAQFDLKPDSLITLRSEGVGESAIQQRLQDMILPQGVALGFRATPDEVQTKLRFVPGFPLGEMRQIVRRVAECIGDYVFAIDGLDGQSGGDLLTVIDSLMSNRSLATLETASGGLLAAKCHGRDWLAAAMIAKDTDAALGSLDVGPEPLDCARKKPAEDAGPVDSEHQIAEVARRLAIELQRRQHANLALVQLFHGTQDDYRDQDGSIVLYNGLKTETGFFHSRHRLTGPAKTKQNQSALLSLDLLRRYLQDKCH
ncbi:competence/damage-inducible protein A [Methylomonas sp. MgM2]